MKRVSFLTTMMRMMSPMTPPTTAKMIRVSVLSTFFTGGWGRTAEKTTKGVRQKEGSLWAAPDLGKCDHLGP